MSVSGDTSKAFPFQFGSIVPGVMNGVAVSSDILLLNVWFIRVLLNCKVSN